MAAVSRQRIQEGMNGRLNRFCNPKLVKLSNQQSGT